MDDRLKKYKLLMFAQTASVVKVALDEQLEKLENAIGDMSDVQGDPESDLISDAIHNVDQIRTSIQVFDDLISRAKKLSGDTK